MNLCVSCSENSFPCKEKINSFVFIRKLWAVKSLITIIKALFKQDCMSQGRELFRVCCYITITIRWPESVKNLILVGWQVYLLYQIVERARRALKEISKHFHGSKRTFLVQELFSVKPSSWQVLRTKTLGTNVPWHLSRATLSADTSNIQILTFFEIMSQSNINRFSDCVTNCCNHILKIVELVKLSMWIFPSILSLQTLVVIPAMNITAAMTTIPLEIIFFIFGRLPSFLPSSYTAFVKLKGVGVSH